MLAGLTKQRPALMIVEDAHWVDPTSLEVFGRTVDQIKTLPVLLIVTFRAEFSAPWGWTVAPTVSRCSWRR
jgi:predicted ATPase